MKLSDGEKLILVMLADLYKHLDVKGDIDADFVSEAITSDHLWALPVEYSGTFSSGEARDQTVDEVHRVLSMWSVIEASTAGLGAADRKRLKDEVQIGGDAPRWPGFDGNHESSHMSVAGFMIDRMNFYPEFKGRGRNSHMPTLATANRMHAVFKKIQEGRFHGTLSVDDLIQVLNEQVHPSNRKTA